VTNTERLEGEVLAIIRRYINPRTYTFYIYLVAPWAKKTDFRSLYIPLNHAAQLAGQRKHEKVDDKTENVMCLRWKL